MKPLSDKRITVLSLLSTTACNVVIPSCSWSSEKAAKSIAREWANSLGFAESSGIDGDKLRRTLDDTLVVAHMDKANCLFALGVLLFLCLTVPNERDLI